MVVVVVAVAGIMVTVVVVVISGLYCCCCGVVFKKCQPRHVEFVVFAACSRHRPHPPTSLPPGLIFQVSFHFVAILGGDKQNTLVMLLILLCIIIILNDVEKK